MSRTRQHVCRRFAFRGIVRATNKLDFVASSPSKTRIPIQIRFPAENTQRRNHAIRSPLVRESRWQTRTYVRSSWPARLLSLLLRQDSFAVGPVKGRNSSGEFPRVSLSRRREKNRQDDLNGIEVTAKLENRDTRLERRTTLNLRLLWIR